MLIIVYEDRVKKTALGQTKKEEEEEDEYQWRKRTIPATFSLLVDALILHIEFQQPIMLPTNKRRNHLKITKYRM